MIARAAQRAAAIALMTAAAPQSSGYRTPDGNYRIVGYNDMAEMLGAATRRVAESGSRIRYKLELKSTRSAPPALIAGTSLLAPMGAAMESGDRAAFRAAWGRDPIVFHIAHDSLTPGALSSPTAILVSVDNPLRSITLAQIRSIYAPGPGAPAIRTWGQIGLRGGWADRPIRAIGLARDTAIGRFVLAGPLRAKALAATVETKRQSRDVADAVTADDGAIGLANANLAGPRLRAVTIIDNRGLAVAPTRDGIRSGRYPFDRFLLIYARRESDGRLARATTALLRALLSPAGQQEIGRETLGYIPLNARELATERAKLGSVSGDHS
ncbi:MAG: substrate-binding domain-containing protein [Proteobacteria bacterium]|nr:substrate-binding domain-containing protein [Pseudomonadota bacterium]